MRNRIVAALAAAAVLAGCGSSPAHGSPAACKAAMLKELQDFQPEQPTVAACRGLPATVVDRLAKEAADEWWNGS